MCLFANKDNPKKGKFSIRFDSKGYATCWKIYDKKDDNCLVPPYYPSDDISHGWIVSDRKSKKICEKNGDSFDNFFGKHSVEHGIHVYIFEKHAMQDFEIDNNSCIVPVRCHKSQLIAIDSGLPVAAFMKVFLKKEDFEKAIKQ